MTIEELAKKFVALASKPILSKAEHEEARKLMRLLKEAGMDNLEISNLSEGKWSESTVKGYTKGVKAPDPSPWQSAVALLDNLISTNMSLDDVETAVTVFADLKSHGINITQVIELLVGVDSASMDLGTMVQQHKELKESGLSLEDIAKVLAIKKELEAKGLSLDSLQVLVKLAGSYGDTQGVLEAVSAYGSLEQLKGEIKVSKDELQNISQQTDSVKQKLEETRTQLSEITEPLQAYHKALELGFGEQELDGLASLASKFGGSKAVLKAIKGYTNYLEIKNKVSEARAELGSLESDINKLSAKHSHLTSAISMCQTLISKYKFGLDAIATIFSVASKYGEPIAVLKNVEAYGKLESIQNELTGLEGKVAERRRLLAELEGKYDEVLEQLKSLNEMALKVGADIAGVKSQLSHSKDVQKLLNFITNPASASYEEHGPIVLAIAKSLRVWLTNNENKFKSFYSAKKGFDNLITELGGN